ncbi:mycothiol transferase [Phytohabitans suffuscus]
MRWALIHMIEETARHTGHMDILREAVDGTTGDHRD